MNETNRTATLAWLLQHAEFGYLPSHLTEESRIYAIEFLQAAISVDDKPELPAKLAQITQGMLKGEYRGTN